MVLLPVSAILLMVNDTAPVFLTVSVRVLLELRATLPNARVEGVKLTVGYLPVPVRPKSLEPVDVLSVMVRVEFSVSLMVGAKVTVATHVAPAAKVLGLRGQLSDSL